MTKKQALLKAKELLGDDAFAILTTVDAERDRAMQNRFGRSARSFTVGVNRGGVLIPYGAADGWQAALRSAAVYQPGNENRFADLRKAYIALNRT